MRTLGFRMIRMDPVHGFSVETSAAFVIIGSSLAGIPVSTTHCVSGSVLGTGATRGGSAVKWGVARRIVWAWILTIPAAAVVAAVTYLLVLPV